MLVDDLTKRLRPPLQIIDLSPSSHKGPAGLRDEGDRIRKALPPKGTRIVLDMRGKTYTSAEFSAVLERWPQPTFIIGGAEGHDPEILKEAHHVLSLGAMTLPHALACLVFVEQLYRAQCIRQNHPYHRD